MIKAIQDKIRARLYEFSRHALDQSIRRDISVAEFEDAMLRAAAIIEDYPNDKYGPSCLILGVTHAGRALHAVSSYPSRPLLKVITLYEPDPALWIDARIRRDA
ncbi:MAG: DUF4258 domain-containing protein [Chromatiaceae bacterium]|nr:MAG: DUF4258 domain-containing protein [Chromatiaceae bacterium]